LARRLSDPVGLRRVVLDSDVIFSRVLHDLFGRLASGERLFTLIWSDELLAEARSALVRGKSISQQTADRWVGYLSSSFPDQRIDIEHAKTLPAVGAGTSDTDDQHVCALAIAGHADTLITSDRGYLADVLEDHGIAVIRPDDVLGGVFDEQPQAILRVLDAQAAAWAGGRPIEELLDALSRAGAGSFAASVRRALID
jgi:predicted nucleic acid-binding protein